MPLFQEERHAGLRGGCARVEAQGRRARKKLALMKELAPTQAGAEGGSGGGPSKHSGRPFPQWFLQ